MWNIGKFDIKQQMTNTSPEEELQWYQGKNKIQFLKIQFFSKFIIWSNDNYRISFGWVGHSPNDFLQLMLGEIDGFQGERGEHSSLNKEII